jgi:5'-nucleotidase / UDP-sugar diphosphatase
VDQGRIAASVVVKERGEEFGIIGAVTPMLPFISSPRNVIVLDDVAAAMQAEVDKLEAMGINKIILISHLQSVAEDIELAPMLSGVDIMVAGGGDEVLANEGDLLVPGDSAFGPYPIWTTGGDGSDVPVVTTSWRVRLCRGADRRLRQAR